MGRAALGLLVLVWLLAGADGSDKAVNCYRKGAGDDNQVEEPEPPEPKPDRCPPAPLDAVRINEAAELVQLVETRKGPPARLRGLPLGTAVVSTRCGQCDLQHFRDEEGFELTCFECEPVGRPEAEEEAEEEEPEGAKKAAEEPKKPYQVSDGFFDMLEQAARLEKEQARAKPHPAAAHAPPPPAHDATDAADAPDDDPDDFSAPDAPAEDDLEEPPAEAQPCQM